MDGLGLSDGTIYIGDGRYDAPSVKKPAAAPHGTYYVPHPRQDLADTSDPESLIITKIEERDNQLSVMGEDSQMVLRTPATAADVKGADARLIERNAELAETNSHLTQQVRELKEIIAARDHRIGQLQHALNGADLEGRILMRLDEMSAQVGSLKTTFQNMGTTFHKQSVMETRSLALHEHNNKLLRDVHARNYHGDFREMEGSPKWNSGVSQCFFSGFAEDFPIPSVAKVDLSSTSQNSRMGMRNPVIAADGHQYERESIEEYIQHRLEKGLELRSPVTNEVLAHTVLTPVRQPANYAPMTSSMMPSGRLSNTVSPSATSNLGLKIILTSQGGLLSANV